MKNFFSENIYKLWLFLYRILKIQNFEYRGLTEGEVNIAKKVFHDLINYNEVIIFTLYTTNFTEPLSYQDSAFLKLPKFP